jgi:hypothetical protein
MSSSLNNLLSQAYGFIEADQLDEAVTLLKPILAENPNNPDAWWLYAHAVENVDDARAALQTVLNLNPNYPEAQRLLDMLEEATKGVDTGNPLNDISLQPIRTISDEEAGITSESEPFDDRARRAGAADRPGFDERMDAVRGRQTEGFPWRNVALLAALFLCAVIGALLVAPNLFSPNPEAAPTDVGADRTAAAVAFEATGTSQAVGDSSTAEPAELTATAIVSTDAGSSGAQAAGTPTAESLPTVPAVEESPSAPTDVSASIDLGPLSVALAPLGDGTLVGVEQTARGESVVITLCSQEPNVSLRDTLRQAVGLLSGQVVVTQPQVQGVGFRLLDCATDSRVLRFLTAAASDVVEYAGGAIDAATFEARMTTE